MKKQLLLGHVRILLGLILSCGILFVGGCQQLESEYISEEKMLDVLRELHLADVLAEANGGSLGWRHAIRNEHYDEILDNFELSRPEFYRSYMYYINRPEIMDSIYVRMVQDIETRMDITRQMEIDAQKDTSKWNQMKRNEMKRNEMEKNKLKRRGPAIEPTTKSTVKKGANGSDS